ncbi:metal ABC transporter permease [Notoacmeibacter ruber]|uniref:High-affinity zinc uptake system membrane protein ZnuB n=1 Tax=Notoacmeibacter ruber TaxID=2670375 RepID=A0A3L7JIV9_9HYPH|nr:metal ABC transporter permease [Notoacmeibacter ruber]RLQ88422.1 hypothetical protein D8780_09600 [Notoacmeibacter ruber]
MLDDFLIRALLGGLIVAMLTAPLGCVVVWRQLAYFGDTLSHAALLGIALGTLASIYLPLAILAVCVAVALLLFTLRRQGDLAGDAILGLLAHGSLALGLVAIALAEQRIDLNGLLFGDIFAISRGDLFVMGGGAILILLTLAMIWNDLLAATVSPEIAAAESARPKRAEMIFLLLLAVTVAVAIKVVGVLLITAMLIIPAITARRLARGPEVMAALAAAAGIAAILLGLYGSFAFDTPAGPSIVVAACALFLLVRILPKRQRRTDP